MNSNKILIDIVKNLATQAANSGEYTKEQIDTLVEVTCQLLSLVDI